jgi:hypothetical protein
MTSQSYGPSRLVRVVLRAFPAAFRARYGDELWQCIRDARRDLGEESVAVTIRFWVLIVADLGRSALMERCRSVTRESWSLALRRTAGVFLLAAALGNVAYDSMSIKLSMGVFVALLTLLSAVTGVMLMRTPGKGR